MKKMLLLLIFSVFYIFVEAQIPHYFPFLTSSRSCLSDTSLMLNQYTDWDIYKTLNDEWDGVIDSTFCGAVMANSQIDFSGLNTGETIFIRYHFIDSNKVLLASDMLYMGRLETDIFNYSMFNIGTNCPNNLCSGVITGVEIPDSAGTGTAMRWYETPLYDSNLSYDSQGKFCLPTEYFANNYLREVIIKLTIDSVNSSVRLYDFVLEEVEPFLWHQIKDSISILYQSQQSQYIYSTYFDHYLVMKSDTSIYPNANGMEYVELKPTPNVDTVVTMEVYINPETSLITQPFVEFRGGNLLNDSTQRHLYNIVNNGGNVCFPNQAEVRFSGGNNYVHRAGRVDFGGQMACMQFGESSKLIVGDDAKFICGSNGMGIIALRSRSSIEIGKNAELVINNKVLLFEYRYDTAPEQIYMTLNEGSKLSFGKNAEIYNGYSIDGQMKLNIYMKGGTIDLSNLDAESYQAVNLIYDEVEPDFVDNIKVLGNPTRDEIRFSIVAEDNDKVTYSLFSLDGKQVQSANITTQKGINYIKMPIHQLANGLYLLNIQSGENTFVKKIIITK